jgi:hypothetical protein
MQSLVDFAQAHGGSANTAEVASYWQFFQQFLVSAQAVRVSYFILPWLCILMMDSTQPVGQEMVMGSRLIAKDVFTTTNSSAKLVDILVEMFEEELVEAYIPVTPPALYNATEETSVTPGWRDSYWHVSSSVVFYLDFPFLTIIYLQFAGATTWLANSTQDEINTAYALVHNMTEILTELSPNTGAYMVYFPFQVILHMKY